MPDETTPAVEVPKTPEERLLEQVPSGELTVNHPHARVRVERGEYPDSLRVLLDLEGEETKIRRLVIVDDQWVVQGGEVGEPCYGLSVGVEPQPQIEAVLILMLDAFIPEE